MEREGQNSMKIAIIGPKGLPIPPVKGGAVETLVDCILLENEKFKALEIDVYTIYDTDAIEASQKYSMANFTFLSRNKIYTKYRDKLVSMLRKVFRVTVTYTYARDLCKKIEGKNYDKVIIEGDASLIIPIANKIGKDRVYFHIHHNPLLTNHDEFRNEISHCHKVIAVSDFIKNGIHKCMGNTAVICKVLKNCYRYDTNQGNVKYTRQYFNLKEDDIVISFSGRPIPDKGVKELLLAFKRLVREYSNIKLMIIGNPGFGNQVITDYQKELEEIAQGLGDRVIFTGFISHNHMFEIYSLSDIGVVPSTYDDPAPLVVIECMASGLPLVVTDSGGIPEYITPECALMVTRNENLVQNLEESLRYLIDNPKLRKEMSIKALNQSSKFTEEAYYYNFLKILKNKGEKDDES